VVAYGLRDECGWLGRWFVCWLHRRAMDARVMCCDIISSCQSAAASEIVKRFRSRVCLRKAALYRSTGFTFTFSLPSQLSNYESTRSLYYDDDNDDDNLLTVNFLLFLTVLNHILPLELFVYLRLIIGILSLCTSAHLTVLSLSNPALNLTFSLLPITSSHPHASDSDSTFDFWRCVNI